MSDPDIENNYYYNQNPILKRAIMRGLGKRLSKKMRFKKENT